MEQNIFNIVLIKPHKNDIPFYKQLKLKTCMFKISIKLELHDKRKTKELKK